MLEIETTEKLVMQILQENEKARNSDNYLIIKVYERIYPPVAEMPFNVVLSHRKDYGLPALETIGRARRKIQANHPELCACDEVRTSRVALEDDFREYART